MNVRKRIGTPLLMVMLAATVSLLLAACGGDPQQQSDESDSSLASQTSPDEACEAFAGMGGLGGFGGIGGAGGGFANLVSRSQGGPSIQTEYSTSAPSDEAERLAGFFEEALTDALGSGVEAKCY